MILTFFLSNGNIYVSKSESVVRLYKYMQKNTSERNHVSDIIDLLGLFSFEDKIQMRFKNSDYHRKKKNYFSLG